MNDRLQHAAQKLLKVDFHQLHEREQQVVRRIVERAHLSRNTTREFDEQLTFGQRLADRVAAFGGSWPFIVLFVAVLLAWVIVNAFVLGRRHEEWDPYPFILLNLMLSMVAALQAPIIMMSQNRHAAKDRLDAEHDYEVNLKAELEVRELHDKLDALRQEQWVELVAMQQEQIRLLTELLRARGGRADPDSPRA